MKKTILVLCSQNCGPFPGHIEMQVVGHFNTDDSDMLKKTAAKIADSMNYIGGIMSPASMEGRAKVIREELIKQGFELVEIESFTVSM
jgi:delta-aminolevulinic acid dehydratase/porphobilinogen synthase